MNRSVTIGLSGPGASETTGSFQTKAYIVLFLLALNVLVSVTAAYFPEDFVHTGIVRAVVMLAAIPFLMIGGARLTLAGLLIVVCLGYLAALIPLSSSPIRTLEILLRVVISLFMFILAYNYLRGPDIFRKFSILIAGCLAAFILNFLLAQVFGLGRSYYHEGGFRTGGGGVQQTYLIAYLVLFLPLLGFFRGTPFRMRWWEISLFLMALFPLVLIGRRGAILGFLAGLLIYLVVTPRKGRLIGLVAIAVGLGIATMPLYIGHVEGVIEHRTREIENPESVGRVQELYTGMRMLREENLSHVLFGSELFNYQAISGGTRNLHTDYATYLIGGGIVGFLLYFGILPALWADFIRRLKFLPSAYERREFVAVMLALLAAYTVISFTGQYYVISSLAVIFFLFGAILAYIEEQRTVSMERIKEEHKVL